MQQAKIGDGFGAIQNAADLRSAVLSQYQNFSPRLQDVARVLRDDPHIMGLGAWRRSKRRYCARKIWRLAISDSLLSSAAQISELMLKVSAADVRGFRTLAAAICLVQGLAVRIAGREGPQFAYDPGGDD